MTDSFPRRLFLVLLTGAVCSYSSGHDFAPKTDNRVVALDLGTGAVLWEHKPKKLSDAHFEMHPGGLAAFPNYSGLDRKNPMFLEPKTGRVIKPFEIEGAPVARSATFWPGPDIELRNGWKLHGFSPGNHKTLHFVDGEGEKVWKIETPSYPHQVRSWRNYVFYAYSYLSKEGVLYARKAGSERSTWELDLNEIVKGRKAPLTRMIFQVIDDVIYLAANEHIFAIEPETGKLLWHRDFAADLGVPYGGGFFGGGLNLAVFSKSGDTLVVGFENQSYYS